MQPNSSHISARHQRSDSSPGNHNSQQANNSSQNILDNAVQASEYAVSQSLAISAQQYAQGNPSAFRNAIEQAFGDKASPAELDKLALMASNGTLPLPDNVRFVDAGTLGAHAMGAYDSANGGTIYLDRRLLNDPTTLQSVYTEELGHHIDAELGSQDAAGDEGAIFSKSLLQGKISATELQTLKAEDDSGFINIDGKRIAVEFFSGYSGPGSSSATGGTDSDSSGSSYSGPGSSVATGGSDSSSSFGNSSISSDFGSDSDNSSSTSSRSTSATQNSSPYSTSPPAYSGPGSSFATGGVFADSPLNAFDNTPDGPNGGNPDDAVGLTDSGVPTNARDNTADGPYGGDPNGWPDNGQDNNTADGPAGGDPVGFEDLTGIPSEWSPPDVFELGPWSTMLDMTRDWAAGTGPSNRMFVDDPVSNSLRDAPVITEARDYWYDSVENGSKTISDPVTNFRGTQRLGGGNFGPVGAWNAGLDPVEQYIGSYGVEMVSDGSTLTYTATNNTSMESFLYGVGPEYERSSFGPGGNLRQTYQFTESIDMNRVDNGAIATTNTSDGPNGGDPVDFETTTNTDSDWSAEPRNIFSRMWNRLTR